MKQESPITLQGSTLKIGPWQASFAENIQDLLIFYQITKAENTTYEATLTLKFQHETMPQKGIQPYENTFLIEFPKNFRTFVEDFEKTKHDNAPYKLEYGQDGMAALKQEERLYGAMRQAFWNTHFQEVIDPLLEIQAQGKIGRIWLVVASEEAFVRNLPWELMLRPYLDNPTPSQPTPNFTIVRTTCPSIQDFELQHKPRVDHQLKLLFVTSLPERLEEHHKLLQVEAEQRELIGRLMKGTGADTMEIDFAEIASLDEIDTLLREGGHHILHISGHGDFKQPKLSPEEAVQAPRNWPETEGLLVLEDEDGNRVDVSGQQLGERLKHHSQLRLVVLSNCNSAKAGAHGLAEDVARQVDAAVIGMRFTVTDFAATTFTTALYGHLAEGEPLAEAFQAAQMALYWNADAPGQRYANTEWFTPVLLMRGLVGALVDVDLAKAATSERLTAKRKTQADHLDSNFIGRRRYLAKIKRILEGPGHLCLYGMKGIGKSALARVAARNYAGENVVVVSEPQDMQSHFEQGEKAVVIVEVLDHHNVGYWIMVGELLYLEFGPKVIVVSYHGIKFFGEQLEPMVVWKLSYAEQWRLVEQSAAFGRWRPQDERPSLQDLEEIFDALDGHVGAIRLLEKAMAGYQDNNYADEIARQLPDILKQVQSQLTFDEIMEEVENLVSTASVFFEPSPFAALVAVTGESEEILREYLSYAQLWGWCFFDGDVFEVHEIVRGWIRAGGFLGEEWSNMTLSAAKYFQNQPTWGDVQLAISYFEMAEEWEEFAIAAFRLQKYYQLIGMPYEALELCESVLENVIEKEYQAEALGIMAGIFLEIGENDNAWSCLESSGALFRALGDQDGEAATLTNLANLFSNQGDFNQALKFLTESLTIRQGSGDRTGEILSLNNISGIYQDKREYDIALIYLKKSFDLQREIGYSDLEGITLNNIGKLCLHKGMIDIAYNYFLQSLQIRREMGDRTGEATVLNNISQIFKDNGDYDVAIDYLQQSLDIMQEVGNLVGEGATLNNIGRIYQDRGDGITSLRYFQKSLLIQKEIGNLQNEGIILMNMSLIHDANEQNEQAKYCLDRSMEIKMRIGGKEGIARNFQDKGNMMRRHGKIEAAIHNFFLSTKFSDQIGSPTARDSANQLEEIKLEIGEALFNEILLNLDPENL